MFIKRINTLLDSILTSRLSESTDIKEVCTGTSSCILFANILAASFAGGLMANLIASVRDLTFSSFCGIGLGPAPALWIILPEE